MAPSLLLDMIINKKFGKLKCPNTCFVVALISIPSDGATPKNEISYRFVYLILFDFTSSYISVKENKRRCFGLRKTLTPGNKVTRDKLDHTLLGRQFV